ncbi:hypothetical protein COEREDRAFT_31143, partial [Coemansia reversa NRRL 1564]
YKTAICDTFTLLGSCKYGDSCNFAHGEADLRTRLNPTNYKTTFCRNEAQGQICPYGAKCDFIH